MEAAPLRNMTSLAAERGRPCCRLRVECAPSRQRRTMDSVQWNTGGISHEAGESLAERAAGLTSSGTMHHSRQVGMTIMM